MASAFANLTSLALACVPGSDVSMGLPTPKIARLMLQDAALAGAAAQPAVCGRLARKEVICLLHLGPQHRLRAHQPTQRTQVTIRVGLHRRDMELLPCVRGLHGNGEPPAPRAHWEATMRW